MHAEAYHYACEIIDRFIKNKYPNDAASYTRILKIELALLLGDWKPEI